MEHEIWTFDVTVRATLLGRQILSATIIDSQYSPLRTTSNFRGANNVPGHERIATGDQKSMTPETVLEQPTRLRLDPDDSKSVDEFRQLILQQIRSADKGCSYPSTTPQRVIEGNPQLDLLQSDVHTALMIMIAKNEFEIHDDFGLSVPVDDDVDSAS